jgi:hypothetical protein
MTKLRKLHRFGFSRPSSKWGRGERHRNNRRRNRAACGAWIGDLKPSGTSEAVPDEQFSLMPRELTCMSCRNKEPLAVLASRLGVTPNEFVVSIELLCHALARLGDDMRELGHGRCWHDGVVDVLRSCTCGAVSWLWSWKSMRSTLGRSVSVPATDDDGRAALEWIEEPDNIDIPTADDNSKWRMGDLVLL